MSSKIKTLPTGITTVIKDGQVLSFGSRSEALEFLQLSWWERALKTITIL